MMAEQKGEREREREKKKKAKREKNTSGVHILHSCNTSKARILPPSIKWRCFNPFMRAIAWGHMSAPRDVDA